MNRINVTNPSDQQCNRLLYAVVTIIEYNKSTIYHDIYIRVFYDGTVYCITVSTGYFLNTNNNEKAFSELRRVFEEYFILKSKKDLSLGT